MTRGEERWELVARGTTSSPLPGPGLLPGFQRPRGDGSGVLSATEETPYLSAQEMLCALQARAVFAAQPCPFTGLPQDRAIERVRAGE